MLGDEVDPDSITSTGGATTVDQKTNQTNRKFVVRNDGKTTTYEVKINKNADGMYSAYTHSSVEVERAKETDGSNYVITTNIDTRGNKTITSNNPEKLASAYFEQYCTEQEGTSASNFRPSGVKNGTYTFTMTDKDGKEQEFSIKLQQNDDGTFSKAEE